MKKIILIIISLIFFIPKVFAVSLSEALTQAYKNNPELNAERENIKVSEEDLNISKGEYLPTLTLSGSKSKEDTNKLTNQSGGDANVADVDPQTTSITVEQTLFDSGRSAEREKNKIGIELAIAKLLKKRGYKVGVSTRGHGRKNESASFLMKDKNWFVKDFYKHWKIAGDETVLLKNNLDNVPVYVSKNKIKAAKYLYEKEGCDVVILDDGFQHRKLYRDIDIVLLSINEKLNKIFPYGDLRESVVGLKRADLIISTITDEHEDEKNLTLRWAYNDYLLIAGTPENKTEELGSLEQYNNILSLCAIGTPENFQKTLKSLNIHYKQSLVYPDHYPFKEKDINKINAFIEKNKIDIILCTEKDLVKLKQHKKMLGVPLAAITINYSLSEGLEKDILNKIKEIV